MRLDHIAYRVKDRYKTARFFKDAFGYTIGTEFQIEFEELLDSERPNKQLEILMGLVVDN